MEVTFQPMFVEGIHDGSNYPEKRKTDENDHRDRAENLQRIIDPTSQLSVYGVGPNAKLWEEYIQNAANEEKRKNDRNPYNSIIGSGSIISTSRSMGGRKRPFASMNVRFASGVMGQAAFSAGPDDGSSLSNLIEEEEEDDDHTLAATVTAKTASTHSSSGTILESTSAMPLQSSSSSSSKSPTPASTASSASKKRAKKTTAATSTSSNMPSLMGTFIDSNTTSSSAGGVLGESENHGSFRASLLSITSNAANAEKEGGLDSSV